MDGVIIVDAANVIGSRPTGWWRDRPGAARDLVTRIQAAVDAGRVSPPVFVVLEGAARAGVQEIDAGPVLVLHAAGHGDDAIFDATAAAMSSSDSVKLITSDRGLQARGRAVGASVAGAGWLLERLD